jgi:DNA-binding response OmpR family regulator
MGARILLVEDQPLIALHMAELLVLEGFEVMGPAHAVAPALDLIAQGPPDAALLDLDLGGVTCLPVAEALAAQDVPFAFLSGHGVEHLPAAMHDRPLIAKPAMPEPLLAALRALLG